MICGRFFKLFLKYNWHSVILVSGVHFYHCGRFIFNALKFILLWFLDLWSQIERPSWPQVMKEVSCSSCEIVLDSWFTFLQLLVNNIKLTKLIHSALSLRVYAVWGMERNATTKRSIFGTFWTGLYLHGPEHISKWAFTNIFLSWKKVFFSSLLCLTQVTDNFFSSHFLPPSVAMH